MTDDPRAEGTTRGPATAATPGPPPAPAAGPPPPPDPSAQPPPAPAVSSPARSQTSAGLPGWVRLAAAVVSTLLVIWMALVRSGMVSGGAPLTPYASGSFIGGVVFVFAVGAVTWAVIRRLRRDQGGLSPMWIPVLALVWSMLSTLRGGAA
jgi:hypothetical protein